MPVFEQGYESYDGPRHPLKVRWWPLFWEEVLPYLKRRRFLFLILLALLPWAWGVALTFLHTQFGGSEGLPKLVKDIQVDESLFAVLLTNGYDLFLLLVVLIWVGSGLIARDRKEGTLEVFLGRALTPLQYLWAKGAALLAFLLIFSLVPALLMVIFQVGLTGDIAWLWDHARVIWGTLLYSFIGMGSLVVFMLAVSSLGRSPRWVGLSFFGVVLFGSSASWILFLITHQPVVYLLSILTQLKALGHACLGDPLILAKTEPNQVLTMPLYLTVMFFILMVAGSLPVLFWRFSRKGVLR